MDLYEIHLMQHPWNGCDDARPWLIVDFPAGPYVGCFPIATECYGGDCFCISDTHVDFVATGLDHTSHVIDGHIIDVPGNSVIKYIGKLQGEMLKEFLEYSGL